MTHARPFYSSVCTPCHAGCWRQKHHRTFQKKSAHSCFLSRSTQHFVCTLPGICHLSTLLQEMLCSDPVLISDEKLLNDTSAKTPCKAEQKHTSGKLSWTNSVLKKCDQIFLSKFWDSPMHLGFTKYFTFTGECVAGNKDLLLLLVFLYSSFLCTVQMYSQGCCS